MGGSHRCYRRTDGIFKKHNPYTVFARMQSMGSSSTNASLLFNPCYQARSDQSRIPRVYHNSQALFNPKYSAYNFGRTESMLRRDYDLPSWIGHTTVVGLHYPQLVATEQCDIFCSLRKICIQLLEGHSRTNQFDTQTSTPRLRNQGCSNIGWFSQPFPLPFHIAY